MSNAWQTGPELNTTQLQWDRYYRIAVEKPVPREPSGEGKKAGTGPYRHSLSNLDNNKLKARIVLY